MIGLFVFTLLYGTPQPVFKWSTQQDAATSCGYDQGFPYEMKFATYPECPHLITIVSMAAYELATCEESAPDDAGICILTCSNGMKLRYRCERS